MVKITLPDGVVKEFAGAISGIEIANSIGAGLAKAALAVKVNNEVSDLSTTITQDAKISIITGKDEEGLDIIRHDTAHILAQAVKQLFPDTQITIGPNIENGFYYDFARDKAFSTDDFVQIEKKMQEIVKQDIPIKREEWKRDDAVEFFKNIGEYYKAEIIASIPAEQIISLYRQGDFVDLCRGPHAPSTGKPKAFKLMKLAGAYWRGDSNNQMLQRIYGTAWANEKDLASYIHRIEEAERRDHRKIGKELELFHIQEEAVGQIFWHDKGWTLYKILQNYISSKLKELGYIEVKTPILVDRVLWEKSGHWDKFRDAMFTSEAEERTLAIKPMSCPCHVQIFNQGIKSYKDLPIKMSEFGNCHRNEPSGALHGLMRTRGFTQDDAHIFCTEDQITEQTIEFCNLLMEVYREFGFNEVKIKFSDRPEVRAGSDEVWDKAENSLKNAVTEAGFEYSLNPGEGAFYGPKLEFVLKDAIGRDWQCGTLQVDFVLPQRLDANYIGQDGKKHRPVMLHRAVFGSFERFIAILIEEYAGKFPLWLSPLQIVVASITSDAIEYAKEVKKLLEISGIRVASDFTNEKINYKVRHHSLQKIPIILIVGAKEASSRTVSLRKLGSNEQEVLALDEFLVKIKKEAKLP